MRSYTATYLCVDQVPGRTDKVGTVQRIGAIEADNLAEAAREAAFACPANWRVIAVEEEGFVGG